MKLPAFEHHRPTSVDEAVGLLSTLDDAKVIAGGQSLVPMLALRMAMPAHLVDVGSITDLTGIVDDGEWIRIGAAVRHSELERWPDLAHRSPLLAQTLPHIGHRAIRNRGTVCGSLAHADPAAELPAAALATGAEFEIAGPDGRRSVAAAEFFDGYLSTAVGDGEMLVEVRFPVAPPGQGAAVVETSRRHGDFAIVGVAAMVMLDHDGLIDDATLAAFGVGDRPVRLTEAERAATGLASEGADACARVGEVARSSVVPAADDYGSTAYKQQLLAVMTKRALETAVSRAGGRS